MIHDFSILLGLATGFAGGLMFVVWLLALRLNNLGIVDIFWSFGFMPIVNGFAWLSPGDPARRGLITVMAGLWSLRLAVHLAIRIVGHHPVEDVRYVRLRADWGEKLRSKTLMFFMFQAAILAGLSVIFLVPCLNPAPGITLLEWTGVALWVMALLGESLADWQLKQFRANPVNHGQVCQQGLWYYSRHPNYFFEWLVWVAYFLFAWSSPGGCYTVLCPGIMLFFLLRVTGIPLTEELSLKRKGDAYRAYQRTTSAFVPWFKQRDPHSTT